MNKRDLERHEMKYGPHFNESCAEYAVSKMENEDGSKGAHWPIDQTIEFADQYGINLKSDKYNKYDWFVALNMIYSDFYKAIINIADSNHIKHFLELTKAWLDDKDVGEGKMWYYYKYVMNDLYHEDIEEEVAEEDEEEYCYRVRPHKRMYRMPRHYRYEDEYDDDEDDDDYYETRRVRNKKSR